MDADQSAPARPTKGKMGFISNEGDNRPVASRHRAKLFVVWPVVHACLFACLGLVCGASRVACLKWPQLHIGESAAGAGPEAPHLPEDEIAGSRMTPASIHAEMRFHLHGGQTNAVKTSPGLGGDTEVPNCEQGMYKGCTRDR